MIEIVISYLNDKLKALGYFNAIYCLCEKITQGELTYPAHYIGRGQYQMIADFDKNDGTIYWLKDGNETQRVSDNNPTSCQTVYEITIPLRAYCVVRKSKTVDDEYSSERIAEVISKELTTNNAALKVPLKAKKVQVFIDSKNTNRDEILSSQFEGQKFNLPYEYSVVELGVNVLITTSNNCIPTVCSEDE